MPSIQFSLSDGRPAARDVDVDYRASKAPRSLFNGHLTSSNSDVRAGDNARRHDRRWNGFVNWWSDVFGGVRFEDRADGGAGPFGAAPTRPPTPLPPNRPANASIPEVADAVQEFLTDWLIRRNYREPASFLAPGRAAVRRRFAGDEPEDSPDRLRQASLQLLEKTAKTWGRPHAADRGDESGHPLVARVRVREARVRAGLHDRRGPHGDRRPVRVRRHPAEGFVPTTTPEYGTYYGALLQVVTEGRPGGAIVLVWRRVGGEWRLVAYRAVD